MKAETVTNLAPHMKLSPALCLDWDGTIRRSKSGADFIKNSKDIELVPGIEEKIWEYRDKGYLIIGISNQGGVAYGFKLPMEIDHEIEATIELFDRNPFHTVKMCYHMEKGKIEPYCHRSLLRKPDIGMLALAEYDCYKAGYIVDWNNSLFVGDRPEDEQCAKNAGIAFQHIDSFLKKAEPPIALPETLEAAVDYIFPRFKGMEQMAKSRSEDAFASFCHSQLSGGIGMKIRNELKLWIHESPLHQYFLTHHNLFHPDEMSDLIVRNIFRRLTA